MIAATSKSTVYKSRREGDGMFFQIPGVCKRHVRGGGIESLDAKIIEYHSCGNKAIAQQKSLSGQRIKEKVTRHAEVDHCDPKKG